LLFCFFFLPTRLSGFHAQRTSAGQRSTGAESAQCGAAPVHRGLNCLKWFREATMAINHLLDAQRAATHEMGDPSSSSGAKKGLSAKSRRKQKKKKKKKKLDARKPVMVDSCAVFSAFSKDHPKMERSTSIN